MRRSPVASSLAVVLALAVLLIPPGAIAQAHSPDEFVTLEQIARCERLVEELIAHIRA